MGYKHNLVDQLEHGTFVDGTPYDLEEAVLRRHQTGNELETMSNQIVKASREGVTFCAECEEVSPVWKMFRCYYCGLFFCFEHAGDHFGQTRDEYLHDKDTE